MSVNYCQRHGIQFDEDFHLECPQCEAEAINEGFKNLNYRVISRNDEESSALVVVVSESQPEAIQDTTELDQAIQTTTLDGLLKATGWDFKISGQNEPVKLTHEEFTTMMALVGLLWWNDLGFTDVYEDALVEETELDKAEALEAIKSLIEKGLVMLDGGFYNLTQDGYQYHPQWKVWQKPPADPISQT